MDELFGDQIIPHALEDPKAAEQAIDLLEKHIGSLHAEEQEKV